MKTLTLDNLPDLYHSILEYWQYFKILSINETDIKDEVLWNNRNILIDKKPVFYRNWFSKNIIHLHHLLNDHGKFYAFDEFKTHDLITLHHVLHATLHTPPLESGFCGSKLHMIK